MSHLFFLPLLLLLPLTLASPSLYNVKFSGTSIPTTQYGSVPLGNGDATSNVWISTGADNSSTWLNSTQPGDLLLYVAHGNAFDENGELLKVGLLRVRLDPPLVIKATSVQVTNVTSASFDLAVDSSLQLRAWLHGAGLPLLVVEVNSTTARAVQATWLFWRTQATPVGGGFREQYLCWDLNTTADTTVQWSPSPSSSSSSSSSAPSLPPSVTLHPPTAALGQSVTFFHRNKRSLVPLSLAHQGLKTDSPYDPLINRTFGAALFGRNFQPSQSSPLDTLVSTAPSTHHVVQVAVHTAQTASLDDYMDDLGAILDKALATPFATLRSSHEAWWQAFWARSHIDLTPATGFGNLTEALYNTSRLMALHRMNIAFQGHADFPIKFNGQLFTVPRYGRPQSRPGYRVWGPGYWWQNTRFPYQVACTAGDWDIMPSLFGFYKSMISTAVLRTKTYFDHGGALFPETLTIYGTYTDADTGYGCKRDGYPVWMTTNTYMRYHYEGAIELVNLMLDYYAQTGDESAIKEYLVPVGGEILTFFREHYTYDLITNKTVFFPSQVLETWQCPSFNSCVENPAPDIAGLHTVIPRILALPDSLIPTDMRANLTKQLRMLPDIPVHNDILQPAGQLFDHNSHNGENAELYSVFPYRLFGQGQGNNTALQLARNSYLKRRFHDNEGWAQDILFAAQLGIVDDAAKYVLERGATKPAPHWRYPAFAPSYQDWMPNLDQLSNLRNGVQLMVLQNVNMHKAVLFPTWPVGWNADVRLHAWNNTVVDARCVDGRVQALAVDPPSRAANIVVIGCGGGGRTAEQLMSKIYT